ncbi:MULTISPECIES: porin [unclassified Pseudoalteromonas]|uniref:porin n=1 Tax=unclassified Pseudoalteromonas TaxID=194690 RepID=UPI0025B37C9D|nr:MULTISPECIES: porin [unclassified Pseudoalteromonas]MDN3377933.1 porin [Pseudoalteromonas sp. APC 3893]MDN3386128.1 porin [Pseudoalteromonas sp. APC 4017]
MNKGLSVLLTATIFSSCSAQALEIYNDSTNSLTIGGFIDARVIHTQGQTEIVNGASRINFDFKRQLKEHWSAVAMLEWGVNPVGSSDIIYNNRFESIQDEFLYNRLGYVGIAHDQYGQLTIGKQWGVWYDVVYSTNYSLVWDGNAAGVYTYNKDDGAINGTGRGDKLLQYRNNYGDLSIAAQVQFKNNDFYTCDVEAISESDCETLFNNQSNLAQKVEFNSTYGAALTYTLTDKLTLTTGFNRGEFNIVYGTDATMKTAVDLVYGAGITYGNFDAKGFYAAANLNKNKNHDTDNLGRLIKKAVGLESLVSYRFDNNIRTFLAYNVFDAGDDYVIQPNFNADPNDTFKRQFSVLGVHYLFDNSTLVYIEARKDFSDFSSADKQQEEQMSLSEDDGIAIGFHYVL